jgi:tRNA U34 2-thiouridine synthase MnmA/TrmU
MSTSKKKIKALGLISGGLDSILAAKVIKDLGVTVIGVHFVLPWGCGNQMKAEELAKRINVPLKTFQLNNKFLKLIKNPQYGVGSGMNPCVDCKVYFLKETAKYMKKINADFIFTGEVLGQRPMSQLTNSLNKVEKESGLKGYLLRPLCAKLLNPTIPEQEGLIDRNKLLAINGRGRKDQIALAKQYNITNYPQPAGGCLLTDPNFSHRLKDLFKYGYQDLNEIIFLRFGRHFRINKHFKAILGRNEPENALLIKRAYKNDIIMELHNTMGPTLILKGEKPSDKILSLCGGIIQQSCKLKNSVDPQEIVYWTTKNPIKKKYIESISLTEEELKKIQL